MTRHNDSLRKVRKSLSKQEPSAASLAADTQFERAVALHQAGQIPQAEAIYRQILRLFPEHSDTLHMLGVMACQVGKYTKALELIDQAIKADPRHANYYSNRGNVLHALQQYEAEVESCNKAIRLEPDFAEAYSNRGNAFNRLQQYEQALKSCDRAFRLKPGFAEAYSNRGSALLGLQQYQLAIESFDKAILLRPDYAEAYNNRGNVLNRLRQHTEALESFNKAILLKAEYAIAYSNRGSALLGLQQYPAALESFDKAILLNPELAEAYSNRASVLNELQLYKEAEESSDKAIFLNPELPEGYNNRGIALIGLLQYQGALKSFEKAILLRHDFEYLHGTQIFMKWSLCEWDSIEDEQRLLESQVIAHKKVATPFVIATTSSSPAIQRIAAETYVRDKYPTGSILASFPRRPRNDKIRIGYFSADYHNHATSYLMAELFERHDRSRFEIIGFSLGPDIQDEMRRRTSLAMDRFLDVRPMSDKGVAQFSRELGVDIAIDMKGFTKDSRAGIFAERAAPIQVSYLGYPGTTGAGFIDYLIADHTLIPEVSQRHYSEMIVYLPDSYQANDSKRLISVRSFARAEEGLPERGFVYCCFNNNYKITPAIFDIWMRILGRVEGSALWLLEDNQWASRNLLKEAARRGISPERLIFAKRLPVAEHLARHSLADLFLDTHPCNANTTASDALWASLPVLTYAGETFASRVAASLLSAIDLPELITTTEAAYEALAMEMALNPERHQAIRKRLHQSRLISPLFDLLCFTKHLEAAYIEMYERYQAHLPTDHIHVARQ